MNRLLTLTFFAALAFHVQCQVQFTVHRFTCPMDLAGSAEKLIITEVKALDVEARISIDGRELKIAARNGITSSEVRSAVQRSGACDPVPVASGGRSVAGENGTEVISDFPVRRNTGDAERDDAEYDAAKHAWIMAHPEGYLNLNQPQGQ